MNATRIIGWLENPYTFRRVHKRWWWLAERFGESYEIVYEEVTVVATTRDSEVNVRELVRMLNNAHRVGIADTLAYLEHEQ